MRKPRRDEILISLAGPAANLLFAVVAVVFIWVVLVTHALVSRSSMQAFGGFMTMLAAINVGLAIFNMIPIPPLDGSHLVTPFLGKVNATLAATYFRYGSIVLLAIILIQTFTRFEIIPISRWTYEIVLGMFRLMGIAGG